MWPPLLTDPSALCIPGFSVGYLTDAGLNSTWLTQAVKQGKMDQKSDSPISRSGCPANLIAITLFNVDIETIKKNLNFHKH